jgi:hypothetical protein
MAVLKRDATLLGPAGFFAACLAVGVWSVRRDRQLRAHARALAIEIPEHVPLRRRRGEMVGLGVVLIVAGVSTFGIPGHGPLPVILGILIVASGLLVLGVLVLGKLKWPFIQFEPNGLRMALRHYEYLIEWSNLARAAPGELAGHDLMLLDVRDVNRLLATVSPASAAPRLAKSIGTTRGWYGADVVLMAVQFGTDIAVLAKAMSRYWTEPEAARPGPAPEPPKLPSA